VTSASSSLRSGSLIVDACYPAWPGLPTSR
jgi:hypothetical protein